MQFPSEIVCRQAEACNIYRKQKQESTLSYAYGNAIKETCNFSMFTGSVTGKKQTESWHQNLPLYKHIE